jgi:hypothetical protein
VSTDKQAADEMATRLALMKSRIAELQASLKTAEGEVKGELAKRLQEASGREELECRRLKEIMDAGLEKWDAIKEQAETAWKELDKALEGIAARLQK